MLTADTGAQCRTNSTTFLNCHLNELANTFLVKHLERIGFQNLLLQIYRQEGSDIVTAVTEGHLRQVVCSKAEVLSFCCDTVSGKSCTRYLNHRTNFVLNFYAIFGKYFFCYAVDNLFLLFELVEDTDKRNHNFGHRVFAFFL